MGASSTIYIGGNVVKYKGILKIIFGIYTRCQQIDFKKFYLLTTSVNVKYYLSYLAHAVLSHQSITSKPVEPRMHAYKQLQIMQPIITK